MIGMRHLLFAVLSVGLLSPLAQTHGAYARQPDQDSGEAMQEDIFMSADELAYDQKNDIVVARGNVELVQNKRVLHAKRIYYYQTQGVVKASGDIVLLQEDGNVLFADDIVLDQQLSKGVVRTFRARLKDNSAFAAAEARRINEQRTVLTNAVYSPCKICRDDPDDEPLWQLKADEITIDEGKQRVSYNNPRFELWGNTVLYAPYFSHPTPGADRTSGFLTPEYNQSSNLGASVRAPYYFNIAPNQDATITPWLTSEEGPVLLGEYRKLTEDGQFSFRGSATYPEARDNTTGQMTDGREFRGHIFADGQSRINDEWQWGFNINRASDDTYLRRYDFGNFETLLSRGYAEQVDGRNHMMLEGLTFQRLDQVSDQDRDPFVIPSLHVHRETDPLAFQGRVTFDANALALGRQEGEQYRRVSASTSYRVPYVTEGGHIFAADIGVRGDAYDQEDLTLRSGQQAEGVEQRVIPHAALSWRYPLMKQVSRARLTVEPMVKMVATTTGNNTASIANEDSQVPELSELNLFENNRFAGLDQVEEGTRLIAGVNMQATLSGGDVLSAMVGQEVQLNGENPFPVSDDPGSDASDIVGRVGYNGSDTSLDARYRADATASTLRRAELRASHHFGRGNISTDYILINDDERLDDREDITASLGVQPWPGLNLRSYGRRDLLNENMITAGVGATYHYDCITLFTDFSRNFTRDRDLEPDTSLTVGLALKNLN